LRLGHASQPHFTLWVEYGHFAERKPPSTSFKMSYCETNVPTEANATGNPVPWLFRPGSRQPAPNCRLPTADCLRSLQHSHPAALRAGDN